MPLHAFIKGHIWRILCFLPLFFVVLMGGALLLHFHSQYMHFALQQEDALWLFTQCQEAEFYRKLSLHSTACKEVMQVFRKTPFHLAMEATLHSFVQNLTRNPMLLFCCLFTTPLLLFILAPIYLAWTEKTEHNKLAFHTEMLLAASALRKKKRGDPPSPTRPFHEPTKLHWRRRSVQSVMDV
jgi:hypothetical protein